MLIPKLCLLLFLAFGAPCLASQQSTGTAQDDPAVLAQLGLLAARDNRLADAIAFYTKALKAAPAMPGLATNLALAYFKSGRFAECLPLLQAEFAKRPQDPQLMLLLGMAHYGMGDSLVAIPFLETSARQQPGNLPLRLTLAHSCLSAQQYPCAIAASQEGLSLDPNSAEADLLLGQALAATGDDTGALVHFRSAEAANGQEPHVHFCIGYILWAQAHYPEAAEEFAREIALNHNMTQSHVLLADSYVQWGRLQDAVSPLQQALQLDENSAIAYRDLGIIDASAGKLAKAEGELRHAVTLDPSDTMAHTHLAHVLQAEGKRAEAAGILHGIGPTKPQHTTDLLRYLTPRTD